MFGVALYVGSAVASGPAASTAQAHDYRPLFWLAALTGSQTVAAAPGRARYR
jgi:hypothetical protein